MKAVNYFQFFYSDTVFSKLVKFANDKEEETVMEFQCPPSVAACTKFTNGVERLDQNTLQNKSKKSMKLSRQAEAKLMEMNICSAYVLEGDMVLDQVDSKTKWVFLLF